MALGNHTTSNVPSGYAVQEVFLPLPRPNELDAPVQHELADVLGWAGAFIACAGLLAYLLSCATGSDLACGTMHKTQSQAKTARRTWLWRYANHQEKGTLTCHNAVGLYCECIPDVSDDEFDGMEGGYESWGPSAELSRKLLPGEIIAATTDEETDIEEGAGVGL